MPCCYTLPLRPSFYYWGLLYNGVEFVENHWIQYMAYYYRFYFWFHWKLLQEYHQCSGHLMGVFLTYSSLVVYRLIFWRLLYCLIDDSVFWYLVDGSNDKLHCLVNSQVKGTQDYLSELPYHQMIQLAYFDCGWPFSINNILLNCNHKCTYIVI